MKLLFRFVPVALFALATLFLFAGCERTDSSAFTAELDEPGYRRAKELLRQGRNQEALAEFQRVVEKRGLSNAPESHLEIGLLYQYHIRDPIAAIYHYRKFRELKPNSPQADLVRQRIEAATREFASKLPGQPMESLERFDMTDVVQRLQRENEQLKTELARMRSMIVPKTRGDGGTLADSAEPLRESTGPAYAANDASPVGEPTDFEGPAESAPALPPPVRASAPTPYVGVAGPASTPPAAPPARPAEASPGTRPAARPAAPAPSGRRHVVSRGDTLYSLAQRYYGNRSRWRDIFEANRDVLRTKDDPLKIGMELKLP